MIAVQLGPDRKVFVPITQLSDVDTHLVGLGVGVGLELELGLGLGLV